MSVPSAIQSPDDLIDRTWRVGHPLKHRLSRTRRWLMVILLMLFSGIIAGYWFVTNPARVRTMAESYLARLTGGFVRVGGASLSIFEGLRLDGVAVYSDESRSPESVVFSAQTFLIQYSPRTLLEGKIEATRIIAIEPQVRLVENHDRNSWNFEDLLERRRLRPNSVTNNSIAPPSLPEVLLRNAIVEYSQISNGNLQVLGSINLEGQLLPGAIVERYVFNLQSRGTVSGRGPQISGDLTLNTGELHAWLKDFEFGRDIKGMLPQQVRRWWEQHGLAGTVDIPELSYNPSAEGKPFSLKLVLTGGKMTIQPAELMGEHDAVRHRTLSTGFDMLRTAGLNSGGFVDRLSWLSEPTPIALQKVDGTFTFTQDRIQLTDVVTRIEDNTFMVNGWIGGYSPDAPASLAISSGQLQSLYLPPRPRYVNSMPLAVREVYENFRPTGSARLQLQLERPASGERPYVTGEVEIVDGQFSFLKFPYPVCNATGKILVERDAYGFQSLKIQRLRGRGVPGGPNEKSWFEINGEMGPVGPAVAILVTVEGTELTSEPALTAAYPQKTQQALRLFDAPGKGEFPRYKGSFFCTIKRYPQIESRWEVDTKIQLTDASGSLTVFPYPMSGLSGTVHILEDYLDITDVKMARPDGASVLINGRVAWGGERIAAGAAPTTAPSLRPDIHITATNVPIDRQLLDALPQAQRGWIEKIGASGRFDLEGKVTQSQGKSNEPDFDFAIALNDCSFWPVKDTAALSSVGGSLRLTPQKLVISDMIGKRGQSEVKARGTISWPTSPPTVALVVEASDLSFDPVLYQVIPGAAQRAWDQVRPEGTVDARLTFTGTPGAESPGKDVGYELLIKPRALSATPKVVPYRLDDLKGEVVIRPGKAELKNLTAAHGNAKLRLNGEGDTGENGTWQFTIAGDDVPADDDLRKALPETLASVFQAAELKGVIGFELMNLKVSPRAAESATHPSGDYDVDFSMKLNTGSASLNVGVPLERVNGSARFEGTSRGGRLAALTGSIDVATLVLSGRDVSDFRATVHKVEGRDVLQLSDLQARVAGGELAGQVDWSYPADAPGQYAMALALRKADVKALTADAAPQVQGHASASLSLQGIIGDTRSRRGRGDVLVEGKELYRIPLLLGIWQVTNLSLPVNTPFSEGTSRYSIEGHTVTFESIELRAPGMMMQGSGNLDFNTKKVNLTLLTENQGWAKLPLVGDLIQNARNELLQIHVRGTIEEPKVSAGMMNTFTTTIDEVFKGGERGK